jgi:hypothetical protein
MQENTGGFLRAYQRRLLLLAEIKGFKFYRRTCERPQTLSLSLVRNPLL